jgi:signal peptidase I
MKFPFFQKKNTESTPKPKKSKLREWVDAIVFAVVVATFLRWLLLEAYTIPTPSMEGSLMTGDFLFVSKLHYGARTPKTPLQIPLTHQKIWFTELPSYLDWIQLPQYRLPHFSDVKSGDVVVFNYPGFEEGQRRYPTDLRTNYIKRCIAVGGDTLSIRNAEVFVNGKRFQDHPKTRHQYLIQVKDEIPKENIDEIGLYFYEDVNAAAGENFEINYFPKENRYMAWLTNSQVEEFKKMPQVVKVEMMAVPDKVKEPASRFILNEKGKGQRIEEDTNAVFPHNPKFRWNRDNFGPLWIPKQGATIPINEQTLALYGFTIAEFEGYDKNQVEVTEKQLLIDKKPVENYTFKQDYYFMMGDNRHNSLDSRYWGFVPADHIVGKALFVWMSLETRAKWYKKIRWNRLFNGIE